MLMLRDVFGGDRANYAGAWDGVTVQTRVDAGTAQDHLIGGWRCAAADVPDGLDPSGPGEFVVGFAPGRAPIVYHSPAYHHRTSWHRVAPPPRSARDDPISASAPHHDSVRAMLFAAACRCERDDAARCDAAGSARSPWVAVARAATETLLDTLPYAQRPSLAPAFAVYVLDRAALAHAADKHARCGGALGRLDPDSAAVLRLDRGEPPDSDSDLATGRPIARGTHRQADPARTFGAFEASSARHPDRERAVEIARRAVAESLHPRDPIAHLILDALGLTGHRAERRRSSSSSSSSAAARSRRNESTRREMRA